MNITNINNVQNVYKSLFSKISSGSIKNKNENTVQNKTPAITPLRDRMISLIERTNGDNEAAERLLNHYRKPDGGGILVAASEIPDLKDVESFRRYQRISKMFSEENKNVQDIKNDIIDRGRAVGKNAQSILHDIVDMYDSQTELIKLGRGWEGDMFSFKDFTSNGWSKTLQYTKDVVDIRA